MKNTNLIVRPIYNYQHLGIDSNNLPIKGDLVFIEICIEVKPTEKTNRCIITPFYNTNLDSDFSVMFNDLKEFTTITKLNRQVFEPIEDTLLSSKEEDKVHAIINSISNRLDCEFSYEPIENLLTKESIDEFFNELMSTNLFTELLVKTAGVKDWNFNTSNE